jgi:hypothetical protein
VIGGGNTATEETLFLTNFASKVTVVHRRDHFRSEKILQDRLFKNPKIDVIWDTVLDDVQGGENPLKVNKVHLKNVNTGAITQKNIDGVFIAIGHAKIGKHARVTFRRIPPPSRFASPEQSEGLPMRHSPRFLGSDPPCSPKRVMRRARRLRR